MFMIGILFTITSISSTQVETQEEQLVKIAKEYKSYSRFNRYKTIITDSAVWNWTIALCIQLDKTDTLRSSGQKHVIDSLHISKASSDASPHGNKLYKLFVKDIVSYNDTTIKFQPIGQVLVKETWNVRMVSEDSVSELNSAVKQSLNDKNWYTPTTVSELFIMYKEPKSNNNDEGWVYGIISLEDKDEPVKILSSGKISSCIGCHKETKYDRIFGASKM